MPALSKCTDVQLTWPDAKKFPGATRNLFPLTVGINGDVFKSISAVGFPATSNPFALRLDPGKPIGAVNCPAGAIERWDAMISSRRLNCSEMVHLDKVGCRCD
jgi:hypothetical protein